MSPAFAAQKRVEAVRRVQTPEGVDVALSVAGPVPRALAWVVDLGVRLAILIAISFVLVVLDDIGMGLFLLLFFALEWLYPVLFEVLRGATPGKSAFGLAVVHDDGTPISWGASTLRNLLRTADFLPIGYGLGLLSTLIDPHSRRLGDLAAGTVVVYVDPPLAIPTIAAGPAIAPPAVLELEEQSAVLAFAERRDTFTAERAAELASLTGPLVADSPDPVARVTSVGRWLLGRR